MSPSIRPGTSEGTDALLADLIEEITDKLRAGVAVDVEVYIARHPERAEQIRELLPALELLAAAGSSPAQGEPTPGERLLVPATLGDFRLLREVGRGGMGIVYEAEQVSLRRRVALKVLPFAGILDPRALQRFHNEAQAAAGLHHTNIVPVYFVGSERGVHYYAMQFIDGQSVAALLEQERRGGLASSDQPTTAYAAPPSPGTPPAETAAHAAAATARVPRDAASFRRIAEWGIQAAEALDCAHQLGIVHRDIKPANLMVDASGRLWVTDFGLAQVQSDTRLTRLTMSGDLVGTLRYMSPEQAQAKRVVTDHRTDIYSLGSTLYELLTLQSPVTGEDPAELLQQLAFEEPRRPRLLNRAIPVDLETIVLKAMEKNPHKRYATAKELADDLARFLRDEPIHARRPTLLQRARKWARRHKGLVRAAAVVGVLSLAFGAALVWREKQWAETERERTQAANERLQQNLRLAMRVLDRVYIQAAAEGLPRDAQREQKYRKLLQEALQFYEAFAQQNSEEPEVRREMGNAYWRVGLIHEMLGGAGEAEKAYQRSINIFQQLTEDSPLVVDDRKACARGWNSIGILRARMGRPEEAKKAFQQLREILETFPEDARTEPEYRQAIAAVHGNDAFRLIQANRHAEAESNCRRAVELGQQLVNEFPANERYKRDLASSLNDLGVVLVHLHRLHEAELAYRDAFKLQQNWKTKFPADTGIRAELGTSYRNLAILLIKTNRIQDAQKAYRQAKTVFEQLVAEFRNVPHYHSELGQALQGLATSLMGAGEQPEARRLLEQAVHHQQTALKIDPQNPSYRKYLRNHFSQLALLLAETGEHSEASKAAVSMVEVANQAMDFHVAAWLLADCVGQAEIDERLSQKKRQELAQAYASQAVAVLREAINQGYMELAHLKKDSRLDLLRSHNEFKKLLDELEDKARVPKQREKGPPPED